MKKRIKNPAKRKVLQKSDESSSEESNGLEWYCIICCNAYSDYAPGENWIECRDCKNWAHSQCLEDEDSL
ncbi:unnamed protein product [Acanthoscelides obtectus]|uniref:Uncharacterized protein n=1 Tax=Acanthoscelides obtectus TaxID=200917 RepID=A0A9P0KA53_ACAOB|nr:unnamed protein product [Acanthoscelides obtectus]CAK1671970.1 hypothetical protein AOBTE_LOCUS28578 [Acanthoscelides obtectus]